VTVRRSAPHDSAPPSFLEVMTPVLGGNESRPRQRPPLAGSTAPGWETFSSPQVASDNDRRLVSSLSPAPSARAPPLPGLGEPVISYGNADPFFQVLLRFLARGLDP